MMSLKLMVRRAEGEQSKVIAEGASLAGTLEAAVRSAEGKFVSVQ